MDAQTARNVMNRAAQILSAAAQNDPLLKDFEFSVGGGSFDNSFIRTKLIARLKNAPIATSSRLGAPITEEQLRAGLATNGTPIIDPLGNKGTIIEARRKKYLYADQQGKQWVAPFASVRLDTERIKAPAS